MNFLNALEQLPFSVWVRESSSIWAFPTFLVLHTIGMSIIAGLSTMIDLVLLVDLAKRSSELQGIGIQEWLSFYFKSPMTVPGLYPEHDLFIQLMKLKNTLRHLKGEELITHLGLEYYD